MAISDALPLEAARPAIRFRLLILQAPRTQNACTTDFQRDRTIHGGAIAILVVQFWRRLPP